MEDKQKNISSLGGLTLLGLLALLLVITLATGVNYGAIVHNIVLLLNGNVDKISSGSEIGLFSTATEMMAVVLIQIAIAVLAASIFSGKPKSYDSDAIAKMLDRGPWLIFAVVLMEELFARGLFLYVLPLFFPGKVAFYVLFILGNGIWAAIHLGNFKDKNERSILVVIPQFLGGIAFTYIFVRFGLVVTILTHYFYDVVIMSAMKEKDSFAVNFVNGLYYLILGVILYFIAKANGVHLDTLSPWLNGQLVPLDGYGFFGYVLVLMLVNCIFGVVINALLLDSSDVDKDTYKNIANLKGIGFLITMSIIAILQVAVILFGNWLFGLVITSVAVRAVVLTIALSMIAKTSSGSAMARATLVNLPMTFIIVVAFSVLGFWTAFGIALIGSLIDFIPNYLESA